jgi:hypothetical protein
MIFKYQFKVISGHSSDHFGAALMSAAFLLAMTATAAQAQFKCVDQQGKTSYRQLPCATGTRSVEMRQRIAASGSQFTGLNPNSLRPSSTESSSGGSRVDAARTGSEKVAATKAAQVEQSKENCNRSRQRVAMLEMGGRVAFVDEKGDRVFLTDIQLEAELEKARIDVRQWCSES